MSRIHAIKTLRAATGMTLAVSKELVERIEADLAIDAGPQPGTSQAKTLRDEFAMAAIAGLLAAPDTDAAMRSLDPELGAYARAAYRHADQMMEARKA